MENEINLEDSLKDLFSGSQSGSGEEEIINVATEYSLQLTAEQMKVLLFLDSLKYDITETERTKIEEFISTYLHYKKHNNSAYFIYQLVEAMAVKKLINENTIKMNIDKKA